MTLFGEGQRTPGIAAALVLGLAALEGLVVTLLLAAVHDKPAADGPAVVGAMTALAVLASSVLFVAGVRRLRPRATLRIRMGVAAVAGPLAVMLAAESYVIEGHGLLRATAAAAVGTAVPLVIALWLLPRFLRAGDRERAADN